jgi:hypothetical protein
MSVTNLYSNLPGHLVEFKDGGLQLTSSATDTSSTKSLLILGTALDGPINEPVKIDATTVSQVFGKEVDEFGYPNGATLTKYAKQAFKNGFDDVRCMRVTGSQAFTTLTGKKQLDIVDDSAIITGAGDAGVVKGNAEFDYDFLRDPEDTNDRMLLTAASVSDDDYIAVTYKPGDEEVQVGLGGSDDIEFNSYRGFKINEGTFPMLNSLRVHLHGYKFLGETTIGDTLGKVQVLSLPVTVDSTTDDSDPEHPVTTINSITAGGGTDDKVVMYNDGTNDVAAERFIDAIANTIDPKFPDISDYDSAGWLVTDNTDTKIDPSNYTITVGDDGVLTITFSVSTSLNDNDIINIAYIPYQKVEINKLFTDDFNASIPATTIDISEMNDKIDAAVNSVSVDNRIIEASKYSVNNGVLTINNTVGMPVGSPISVSYTYKRPIVSELTLKVKSQWGGEVYNKCRVKVEKRPSQEDNKTYTVISFKRGENSAAFEYSSRFYKTIDDLILAMQNDLNNLNLFSIEIVEGEGNFLLDVLDATPDYKVFTGGDNGLNPDNDTMFKALSGERYVASDIGQPITPYSDEVVTEDMIGYLKTQGAYQILENYNVDYIYPAGVYADSVQTVNPNSDFQRELALICAVLTYRTKMTHGFIDIKPNSNTTLIGVDAYVSNLVNNHPNIYYMTDQDGSVIYDSNNKPMDIGWYTSVVVGPEPVMTSDTLGTYYGSPAIAYAALNAVIAPQSSPLNKALRNVNGMKFKFSNKQMDAIVGNRMVCFKLKNEGMATASSTPYVVDGRTAGAPQCDYSDIVTVKVVTDVVDNIREVADPFIGEQNTTDQRNALSALISKRLAKLVELGEIQSYEFEVSATIQQQLLGEASIALTIVPALTLRKITTVVALRAAQ